MLHGKDSKNMQRIRVSLTLAALIGSTFAFANEPQPSATAKSPDMTKKMPEMKGSKTILDDAHGTPEVSTFLKHAEESGLKKILAHSKEYTVLAPTNDAYEACTPHEKDMMMDSKNAGMVRDLVIPGKRLMMADLKKMDGQTLKTMQGGQVVVHVMDDKVMVGDAAIAGKQWMNPNATMFEIDKVIMPAMTAGMGTTDMHKKMMGSDKRKEKEMRQEQKMMEQKAVRANEQKEYQKEQEKTTK